VQGKTPLDSLLEYYRRSVAELSSDEAVHVKEVENLLRSKMRSGMKWVRRIPFYVRTTHKLPGNVTV